MAELIHKTAVIARGAELGADVEVGPFCVVGPKVRLGDRTKLVSHVSVEGRTTLGPDCAVHPFAAIGQPPQDLKYQGEDTAIEIGSGNIIRENVTIHRGSGSGGGLTQVGDSNFIMAYAHIAHDCHIGSHVIMANHATLAGHVTIEDHVVISGLLGIHQNVTVGEYTMVGGMSRISNDVPPYVIVAGSEKPKLYGINSVGLKRGGFTDEEVSTLKSAYKILFRSKETLEDAIRRVKADLTQTRHIKHLLGFLETHKRGMYR
jgi:UDP-N-acetylglucosamine acyltransferase